jgi:hypothetical protein
VKHNGGVDTKSLTESIALRQSGMRDVNALEIIDEIIHRFSSKVGDGGGLDAEGT